MRCGDGANRPCRSSVRLGREKNPSVISAEAPSSMYKVATPGHVTVNADSDPAAGTSNRSV
jgi:hypothetical protein